MSDKPKDSTDAAKEVAGTSKSPDSNYQDKAVEAGAKTVPAETVAEPRDLAASADPYDRADAAGIGLIAPSGGESYVGVSPNTEQDPEAVGPDGTPIGKFTITSLRNVPFDRGYTVKDPDSGEFYKPDESCTSWENCNLDGALLIPESTAPAPAPTKKKAGETDAEFKARQDKATQDQKAARDRAAADKAAQDQKDAKR